MNALVEIKLMILLKRFMYGTAPSKGLQMGPESRHVWLDQIHLLFNESKTVLSLERQRFEEDTLSIGFSFKKNLFFYIARLKIENNQEMGIYVTSFEHTKSY